MDVELVLLISIGFGAQLVDGALGMAFGVISTTAVMAIGIPPLQASAVVHTAEVFTTGASGAWHVFHGNVDWRLMLRLAPAGVLGAVLGAFVLSHIDASALRPFVSGYLLLMGVYILLRAAGLVSERTVGHAWTVVVGFFAGLLDAGGGGWGPVATSSLVGVGHGPRHVIGSVNTAEFFVTVAAATTFFFEIGPSSLQQLVPLALGGIFAAPLGGWVTRLLPARVLMAAVGVLIIALAVLQLTHAFKAV